MIIAIDLDDILASTLERFIQFHNEKFSTNLTINDFTSYELQNIEGISNKEEAKRLKLFDNSKYFDTISPLKGSQTSISQLSKNHDIIVITARTRSVAKKTTAWIKKNFPEIKRVVFISEGYKHYCKMKSEVCKKVGAEVIIEDKKVFVEDCVSAGIKVFMFNYPWNKEIEDHPLIVRVNSWEEVVNKIDYNC